MERDHVHIGAEPVKSKSVLRENPTGVLAAVISALVVGLSAVGVSIPGEVAAAVVVIPAFLLSAFKPRWARAHGIFYRHPAAFTAAATTLIAFIAARLGVEIDGGQVAVFVGGLTALVGLLTPRDGS
jgi:hypothetical protein